MTESQLDRSRFYSAGELAAILNVSPRTIARAVKDGRLCKPIFVGRYARWPADALRKFSESATAYTV